MSTARDLIYAALLDLGAIASGETPTAAEAMDAFRRLNLMLEQWRLQSLLVYAITSASATGKTSYTVGQGGDFNIARPIRLEHAVQRVGGQTPFDYPLAPLNDAEWQAIGLKTLVSGIASSFYWDRGFPLGTVTPYPLMNTADTLILYPWTPLAGFATLDDPVSLPPGYELALQTNLTLELSAQYRDCQVSPLTAQQAMQGVHLLKVANQRPRHLGLPAALQGWGTARTGTDRAAFYGGWSR